MGALVILLVLLLVSAVGWGLQTPASKGRRGESKVNLSLRNQLDAQEYQVFKDLLLPSQGGTTQVDHIVLSRFGIFVIETKNMNGLIYGGANQSRWTQVTYADNFLFQNPIRQNYKHIKAVQELLGAKAYQIHNVVVFVGSAVPKTNFPNCVLWGIRPLMPYIASKRKTVIDACELEKFSKSLRNDSIQSNMRTRRAHVNHLAAQARKRQQYANCPNCGAGLVERTNKKSGERFLGCPRYPNCRGSRKLI